MDRELVTAVSSFLYLNHASKGVLATPSNRSIPFDLSSLLLKARVLGFTLAAFSEGGYLSVHWRVYFQLCICLVAQFVNNLG